MNRPDWLVNVLLSGYDRESKTAPESVALTADLNPGPNRPHLSERGPAVSIMLPPDSQGNNPSPGWRANDLTPHDVAPLLQNFITKFVPGAPDECWPWGGQRMKSGYGLLGRSYRASLLAHRVSWVAFTGKPLTGNLTIDHLCNYKPCVNPDHLEPVTLAENVRRKSERLGYNIGARAGKSGPRRRSPRPIAEGEDRAQRTRKNSLAYYYANRDEILAKRRATPRTSNRETCTECGIELRHDGMRRHLKRTHGAA